MPAAEGPHERARRRAAKLLAQLGQDIRDARLMTGTGQAAVARAARVSTSTISRIESAKLEHLSVREAIVVADAVGLDLSIKSYPGRRATRDQAHAKRLTSFLAHVASPLRFATEVALPHRDGVFEQRAWDAMLFSDDGHTGVELEQRLHDVQAQTRRIMLKWRDSGADRLLLLIANTSHNRAVLETFPEYFVELPALAADDVMAAISRGERPPTGYVLI